jgi:hypothetical protein
LRVEWSPLNQKSKSISIKKDSAQKTKQRSSWIWLAKVLFAFHDLISKALDKTEPPPTPIAIPNEEIKGYAHNSNCCSNDPIHCPTNMVSIKILTDKNKIPIDAGTACLIKSFWCLVSLIPRKQPFMRLFFYSCPVIDPVSNRLTPSSLSFKQGIAFELFTAVLFKFMISFHCNFSPFLNNQKRKLQAYS